MTERLLLTCEHAGCVVPSNLRTPFHGKRKLLMSHRGWDPYAWEIARNVQKILRVPLLVHRVSRLVVEVNRSPGHPKLFSEITRALPEETKRRILKRWYHPHRAAVLHAVGAMR